MRRFSAIAARALLVCILLATLRMRHTIERAGRTAPDPRREVFRAAGIALVVLVGIAASAFAQQPANDAWTPPPHVRPEHPMRSVVEEAARRSELIRDLIEQLEALDVTVYVRCRAFAQLDLEGRVALMASAGGHRDLMIELAC